MRRNPTVPLKEEVKYGHGFFRGEKCPLSGEEGVLVMSPRHLDQFGRIMAGVLRHFPDKFDLVIGNPPYVRQEKIKSIKPYLEKSYSVYTGVADLYVYFFELGTKLLKENAVLNYIISNKWMKANYGKNTRNHLVNYYIDELIDFGDTQIFDGATTYPCIIKLKNKNKMNSKIKSTIIENNRFGILKNYIKKNSFFLSQSNLKSESWNLQNPNILKIYDKITSKCLTLEKIIGDQSYRGILSGLSEVFIINEKHKRCCGWFG